MSASEERDEHARPHAGHAPGGAHGGGGHGGEEAHEGAPEWLISFADNVALMMGFFVLMLAFNMNKMTTQVAAAGGEGLQRGSGKSPDVVDFAISVREAFNNPVSLESLDPREAELVRRLRERSGRSRARDEGMEGAEHDVRSIRPGDYFAEGGMLSFQRGQTELDAGAPAALEPLLEKLRGINTIVVVVGHVSAAEAADQPDRGLELSYRRALRVAQALVGGGIGWNRIRLDARGDNDRVVPLAYDDAGHARNQRVEIIVTDQAVPEYARLSEPTAPDAAAGDARVADAGATSRPASAASAPALPGGASEPP